MFFLSNRSKQRLVGVHEDLVKLVYTAIEITAVDFLVLEGVRDIDRQRELVHSGASMTMDSRHLTGHAVDLAAWVGEIRWDWPLYYRIALAMKQAAHEHGVKIEWGGVWDRLLNDLSDDLEEEVADYVMRRRSLGRKAFTDGPHFQLPRKSYP